MIERVQSSPYETDEIWLILEHLADPNTQDELGNTALHYAVEKMNRPIILTLLLFGADVAIENKESKKPLDMTTNKKHNLDEVIKRVDEVKVDFFKMGKKRRNRLSKIFFDVDNKIGGNKQWNKDMVKRVNKYINGDDDETAREDAEKFIKVARLFKEDEVNR